MVGQVGVLTLLTLHGIVGGVAAQTGETEPAASTTTVDHSATESEQDDRRARVHFESGRQYFDEGEYERAVEEFTRAYELSGRPALLMNVASGLERLGRHGEAADRMQAYHDQAEDTVPTRDVLVRRIANLRERAASMEVSARDTPPSEASPTVDSRRPPPRVSPVEEPARRNARRLGVAISFGVAGAGLVTFDVLGGLAWAERSAVDEGCGATRGCSPNDVKRMDRLALGADLGLGIAAAGATAGVLVVLLVSARDDDEPRVVVVPFVGHESGGALVRGRF
ncbi:MAG: hypothetical protein H6721_31235 [Sandaracinus sp.]|nr:hypothetical protein [Sandaracinus sp.]MCB9636606.1 hypothetical protein [Sandaracinus sp.]